MSIGTLIATLVTETAVAAIKNKQGDTIVKLKAERDKWRTRAINFENSIADLQAEADTMAKAAQDKIHELNNEIRRLKTEIGKLESIAELGVAELDENPFEDAFERATKGKDDGSNQS